MEHARHTQSRYKASQRVHGRRQEEGRPVATPGLYVRPELRREGDLRDVTLGVSPGLAESGQSGTYDSQSGAPRNGEGEGFIDQPVEQGQKKEKSGGEGSAFRRP